VTGLNRVGFAIEHLCALGAGCGCGLALPNPEPDYEVVG
jgi:hypothetical protein